MGDCADLADLLGDAYGDESTMHDAALFLTEARGHMSQVFRSIPADIAQEVASNEVEQRTQQTEDASAAESESTDESDQDFLRAANSATIPAGSAEPVDGNFASQMAAHGATTTASGFFFARLHTWDSSQPNEFAGVPPATS